MAHQSSTPAVDLDDLNNITAMSPAWFKTVYNGICANRGEVKIFVIIDCGTKETKVTKVTVVLHNKGKPHIFMKEILKYKTAVEDLSDEHFAAIATTIGPLPSMACGTAGCRSLSPERLRDIESKLAMPFAVLGTAEKLLDQKSMQYLSQITKTTHFVAGGGGSTQVGELDGEPQTCNIGTRALKQMILDNPPSVRINDVINQLQSFVESVLVDVSTNQVTPQDTSTNRHLLAIGGFAYGASESDAITTSTKLVGTVTTIQVAVGALTNTLDKLMEEFPTTPVDDAKAQTMASMVFMTTVLNHHFRQTDTIQFQRTFDTVIAGWRLGMILDMLNL